ncbi:cytosolic phospholipase A2 gamma-like [Anas acuta]|uniref:cytosolic phospholipase A2 gamma-like n=1 Tax=Anas acuta TaxID=28680 RepID=UPI0035C8B4AC
MATKDDNEVRVSSDLSEGEIKAIQNRRERVKTCLHELLDVHFEEEKVPNIVVLGSGGGLRAMIALLGTLVELKNQNILDAVMYLCGVSGSTWCMSMLYTESKWSEKLKSLEENLIKILTVDSCDIGKEIKYLEESSEDEHYSLTDVWACVVYGILHQFDENKLTDYRDASESGINPYPIYAAVDKKKLSEAGASSPGTWFEFTPHEAGYTALGAFVSTENFGSKFENGKLMEKKKEKSIFYMQGLWGSALGSMEEILKAIRDYIKGLLQRLLSSCETRTCSPCGYGHESMSNTTEFSQAALLLLELQPCAVSGRDPEEVFNKLLKILSGK